MNLKKKFIQGLVIGSNKDSKKINGKQINEKQKHGRSLGWNFTEAGDWGLSPPEAIDFFWEGGC